MRAVPGKFYKALHFIGEFIVDMTKKQLFLFCFLYLLMAGVIVLLSLPYFTRLPSAEEVFRENLRSIVELRASAAAVGESYGTAEFLHEDGTLVTNAHVVTYTKFGKSYPCEEIFVRFIEETGYRSAELVKYDEQQDLAVLKLAEADNAVFKPIPFGNSENLRSGAKVYAAGNASNYGVGIFEGIVSIPRLNIQADGHNRRVIQCDLTVAAGNSGGALLNERGELIGITSFRTRDPAGNIIYGIAYSIPVEQVLEYAFGSIHQEEPL